MIAPCTVRTKRFALFWLLFSLAALFLVPLSATYAQNEAKEPYKDHAYQNLRNQNEILPEFIFVGNEAAKYATPEPGGLHVKFPAKRDARAAVGLQTRFDVVGDFAITGTYELLSADTPVNSKNVAGVNLYIQLRPDGKRFARFGRFSTQQGPAYAVSHTDSSRATPNVFKREPTVEKGGELQIAREGKVFYFRVKDGTTDGKFKELEKTELGDDELSVVRFVVNTDNQPYAADARLIDLRIGHGGRVGGTAPNLGEKPANQDGPAAAAKEASKVWLTVVLVLGLGFVLLLALVVGGWFLLRQGTGGAVR